jgi:hypothetical protein
MVDCVVRGPPVGAMRGLADPEDGQQGTRAEMPADDACRGPIARRSLIASPFLAAPRLALSNLAAGSAAVDFDLRRVFFQGPYFDVATQPDTHLARYLVRPLLPDAERRQRGNRPEAEIEAGPTNTFQEDAS